MSTRNARSPAAPITIALGLSLAIALAVSTGAGPAHAAGVPGDAGFLGVAESHAIIAGSVIANTGNTEIFGDMTVFPAAVITGFALIDGGPGLYSGVATAGGSGPNAPQIDSATAYNYIGTLPMGTGVNDLSTTDLAGLHLGPGLYSSGSGLGLASGGDLTLTGGPNDVFIFWAVSGLTIGSASKVLLEGGARWCNVFWEVGSTATIGTTAIFNGTVLALTSITAATGADIHGRLLARTAEVTLGDVTVNATGCASGFVGGGSSSDGNSSGGSGYDGDGLAYTGSGDSWIGIGIGSFAVIAGFGAWYLARRSGLRVKNEEV